MKSHEMDNVWFKRTYVCAKFFVGFIHIFSDQSVKTLKSTRLVAYSIHTAVLNLSLTMRRCLIDGDHTLVRCFPVCGAEE